MPRLVLGTFGIQNPKFWIFFFGARFFEKIKKTPETMSGRRRRLPRVPEAPEWPAAGARFHEVRSTS